MPATAASSRRSQPNQPLNSARRPPCGVVDNAARSPQPHRANNNRSGHLMCYQIRTSLFAIDRPCRRAWLRWNTTVGCGRRAQPHVRDRPGRILVSWMRVPPAPVHPRSSRRGTLDSDPGLAAPAGVAVGGLSAATVGPRHLRSHSPRGNRLGVRHPARQRGPEPFPCHHLPGAACRMAVCGSGPGSAAGPDAGRSGPRLRCRAQGADRMARGGRTCHDRGNHIDHRAGGAAQQLGFADLSSAPDRALDPGPLACFLSHWRAAPDHVSRSRRRGRAAVPAP